MPLMARVETSLTGVAGAPYYSRFFFASTGDEDGNVFIALAANFWASVNNWMDGSCTMTTQAAVDVVDDATGEIVTTLSGASVTSTGSGSTPLLPRSNQMLVRWRTPTFVGGRRIAGKTYIPALAGTGSPTPGTAAIGDIAAASNNLIAAAGLDGKNLLIFSPTHLQSTAVNGSSVWEQYAIMRSRRD